MLRRRPEDLGLHPDGGLAAGDTVADTPAPERNIASRQAVRDVGFWWLTLAFAASTFAAVALTVHLIPYLQTHGHSAAFAATVAGLFGLMSLAAAS